MCDMGDGTVNEVYDFGFADARRVEQEQSREELVVRRLPEEGFNRGQLGVVDDLVAADMREYQLRETGHPDGPVGVRAVITSLRSAFPDFRLSIQDLAVAGDVVAKSVRLRFQSPRQNSESHTTRLA